MVINKVTVTSSTDVNYDHNVNYTIFPGQKMTLKASCKKELYNSDASAIAPLYDINYKLESIDLDGEGRIKQDLFKGGIGATTYDFYLKDHLGSTRAVVDEDGAVTEATMYYPYGTMVPLKSPAPGNNAREKFTGKELDSVYLPASEIAFNLQINNFDAGMHYYGELFVNLVDLASNQSLLKVYEMTYDKNSQKFTLNTSERFPDNMKITHLRISTSGATNTINYEKDFIATVNTENGLTISLTANGSDLINSSTGYFTSATFVPIKVAGSKLYYFGARYYDPEIGVWGSTDPEDQFFSSYTYTTNPINFVDPDGRLVGQLILQMAIGSAMSTAQYAISSNGNMTRDGLIYSAISGAAGGAVGFGCSYLLGNVANFSPAANAILEPMMRGTGTFLTDVIAQQIAYGKVDVNQALIRGGVQSVVSGLSVAVNGALVSKKSIIGNEEQANFYLSGAHKYRGGIYKRDVDVMKRYDDLRIGGIKGAIAFKKTELGYVDNTRRGHVSARSGDQWKSTALHELYHMYGINRNDHDYAYFDQLKWEPEEKHFLISPDKFAEKVGSP
jgi:hypothetical protein